MPRNVVKCSRGNDAASDLKPPVVYVLDVANLPQNVWRKYPRPEQLPENRRNPGFLSDDIDHITTQVAILPFRTSPAFSGSHMFGEGAEGLKFSGGEEDRERQKQLEVGDGR
jgi:hypothetical protein